MIHCIKKNKQPSYEHGVNFFTENRVDNLDIKATIYVAAAPGGRGRGEDWTEGAHGHRDDLVQGVTE